VVLQLLLKESLFAKLSKCSFGLTEIDYLGHSISSKGVHMDKIKVQAIVDWQQPKNVKQLRGFLGLTGYYRRFIRNYATIAAPLTNMLKKDAFQWNDYATEAFQRLKQAITSQPVLALPNFNLPLKLETDASGSGIGAVLKQVNHPIAYFSKKLSPLMQQKSAYIREFYAITEAIAKFRHYLIGKKFIIRTDQQSLRSLLNQSLHTQEQHKWLHKLLGYDFEIQYKPGDKNIPADALSRSFLAAWSTSRLDWLDQLKMEIQQDAQLQSIWQQCSENNQLSGPYHCKNDLLLWKNRIVIPA